MTNSKSARFYLVNYHWFVLIQKACVEGTVEIPITENPMDDSAERTMIRIQNKLYYLIRLLKRHWYNQDNILWGIVEEKTIYNLRIFRKKTGDLWKLIVTIEEGTAHTKRQLDDDLIENTVRELEV